MRISYIWPIALIVVSNVFYAICSKSLPDSIHPMAALTMTYLVGAIMSAILYFLLSGKANILAEWRHLNWTSIVLGLVVVGLEAGSIFMYKAGWNVNTGYMTHSTIVALLLIFVGRALYAETITPQKIFGVIVCLSGLYLINRT